MTVPRSGNNIFQKWPGIGTQSSGVTAWGTFFFEGLFQNLPQKKSTPYRNTHRFLPCKVSKFETPQIKLGAAAKKTKMELEVKKNFEKVKEEKSCFNFYSRLHPLKSPSKSPVELGVETLPCLMRDFFKKTPSLEKGRAILRYFLKKSLKKKVPQKSTSKGKKSLKIVL